MQIICDRHLRSHSDPECIYKFQGNDVAIPIFVIVELDDQKNEKGHVAFASESPPELFPPRDDGDLQQGVYLEEQDITVVTGTTGGRNSTLQENNKPRKMDLWIMQSALDRRRTKTKWFW